MALYGIISSLLGDNFYNSSVQDILEVFDSILLSMKHAALVVWIGTPLHWLC